MWKLFNKNKDDKKPASTSAKATAKEISTARAPKSGAQAYGILLKPIVSEKAAHGAAADVYSFSVNKSTNKIEIAKAFQALYRVKPLAVRIVVGADKAKRHGRVLGIRPGLKKAIIRVPKNSKISIFANV